MALVTRLGVVLLLALLPSHAFAAPSTTTDSGKLRWVRGQVTAVSTDTLTLKLRSKELTVALDGAVPPAIGTLVEMHYVDKRGARRAVLIFAADPSAALSKSPGTSYRGVITRFKWGKMSLTADAKSHRIKLDGKTRLVDMDGRILANGSKAVAGLMPVGEDVVVKYEDDGGTMVIGDTTVAAGADQALEIRKLR